MADWVTELAEALEKENKILDNLADLAQAKTGALQSGDVARIDEAVNLEQPLVQLLDDLEQNRLGLLNSRGVGHMTLSQLAELAGETGRPLLLGRLDELTRAAGRLREANKRNSIITRSRLEFYEYLSGKNNTGQKTTYGNSGRVSGEETKPGLFDTKI